MIRKDTKIRLIRNAPVLLTPELIQNYIGGTDIIRTTQMYYIILPAKIQVAGYFYTHFRRFFYEDAKWIR
ncbi:hypothetical protein J6K35_02845, partial [bacterium]|nr:hypothetical protein [bacterium]